MRTSNRGHGRRGPANRSKQGHRATPVVRVHPQGSSPDPAEAVRADRRGRAGGDRGPGAPSGRTKRKRRTIQRIVRRGLCTGCGACVGVCPADALTMCIDGRRGGYIPRIDKAKCTRCGLCVEACPGHSVDFEGLAQRLFGDIPEDIILGRYLGSYVGYAVDRDVRYDSASGGLVTALLIYALERKLIDGALVTRMRADKPLEPEPFIARTREEILSAARSKYCPVAADVALKEILRSQGQFAVVGLPCHIQGLRKAEQRIAKLRERIRYRISLACSLTYGFWGTIRLLQELGIPPASVAELEYRGCGWPGTLLVRQKDGAETRVPLTDYHTKLRPFSLRRCTLCSDMAGELSDLSCGDAWLPELVERDRLGSSFVLTRTSEAEELLESAATDMAVELSELDATKLKDAQSHATFKKRKLTARMSLLRWTGRSIPRYRQRLLRPARGDYSSSIKFYLARHALSGRRPILNRLLHAACLLKRRNRKDSAAR